MVKMKEQDAELFFVEVKEPGEVRRNILEILKDILETLRRFEKFRRIRHEKIENMHNLRSLLKDANKMLGSLKSRLPQTNLRAVVKEAQGQPTQPKASHKKRKKGKNAAEKTQQKGETELEKLESQLSAIESKLKSLT